MKNFKGLFHEIFFFFVEKMKKIKEKREEIIDSQVRFTSIQ